MWELIPTTTPSYDNLGTTAHCTDPRIPAQGVLSSLRIFFTNSFLLQDNDIIKEQVKLLQTKIEIFEELSFSFWFLHFFKKIPVSSSLNDSKDQRRRPNNNFIKHNVVKRLENNV